MTVIYLLPYFWILILILPLDYFECGIVGPQNWFTKLDTKEQDFVRQRCTRNASISAQERVVGGNVAEKGQFKHAVVFVAPPKNQSDPTASERTHCTGTLISPRHVITARHCWTLGDGRLMKIKLKFGGLCYTQGKASDTSIKQECVNGSDMYTAAFDFAMFDYDPNNMEGDFAIVQLKSPIDEEFFNNNTVDIACLPKDHNEPLPEEFFVVGWGLVDQKTETKELHFVKLKTLEDCGGDIQETTYTFCSYNDTDLSNVDNSKVPWIGGNNGDSGGGAVYYSDDLQRFILIGVLDGGTVINKDGKPLTITMMVALTNYLEDICYYIGICGENQYGFYRILDMGSIYFPDRDRSTYPDLIPFRSVSFEENKEVNERCKKSRDEIKAMELGLYKDEILNPNMTDVNSETVCKLLQKYEAEARGWSFHLTHRNIIYCGLTAVTSRHFVTSRTCIRSMLKIVNGSKEPLSVKQFPDDDPSTSLNVQTIGWYDGKYPLAIVQIKEQIPTKHVVCLQDSAESMHFQPMHPLSLPIFVLDEVQRKSIKASYEQLANSKFSYVPKKQCDEWTKHFCTLPYTRAIKCPNVSSWTKNSVQITPPTGYGVFDLGRFAFSGIHLENDELERENWTMYLAAGSFIGTLCTFLNRCEIGTHTFTSHIPYFNHFYEAN